VVGWLPHPHTRDQNLKDWWNRFLVRNQELLSFKFWPQTFIYLCLGHLLLLFKFALVNISLGAEILFLQRKKNYILAGMGVNIEVLVCGQIKPQHARRDDPNL